MDKPDADEDRNEHADEADHQNGEIEQWIETCESSCGYVESGCRIVVE